MQFFRDTNDTLYRADHVVSIRPAPADDRIHPVELRDGTVVSVFRDDIAGLIEIGSPPVVYRAPAGDLAIVTRFVDGAGFRVEAFPVLAYRHEPVCFPMMPICAEAELDRVDAADIALCCGGGAEVTATASGRRYATVEAWMADTITDFDPAKDMASLPGLYTARLV